MRTEDEFEREALRYRRELLAACYQLLGAVTDAEDVVQETYLRAWRARDRYDVDRGSVRTWLHHIATNACLTALAARARRPLPSTLVEADDDPERPLVPALDVPWLQPLPAGRVDGGPDDPAYALLARRDLGLAVTAARQLLPARQRAVVVLRDVLRFPAADVAAILDTSVPAVNSLLQRARRALADRPDLAAPTAPDPAGDEVVARYVAAFERGDVPALVRLLAEDAVLEMPPVPLWYRGRGAYGTFLERVVRLRGAEWRTRPLRANGQAGFAAYAPDGDAFRFHTVQVLEVAGGAVTRTVVFADPAVAALFGLPPAVDP